MFYLLAAIILIVLNGVCLVGNMFMLPGNWMMVVTLCVFLLSAGTTTGPDWTTLIVVLALAIVGEFLEMFAGSAKAAKKGASRRAMLLSLVVSMAGSIGGAFVIPIPVVGSAVGAILGAAAGAFAGAWMGEAWVGTDVAKRTKIGKAAMSGRMLGMLGKFAVGAAIFVFQLVSLW